MFQLAGYEIDTDETSAYYMPVLLTRLPPDIARFLPSKASLAETLEILEHIDKESRSTLSILTQIEEEL
jgi:hypothetical protein